MTRTTSLAVLSAVVASLAGAAVASPMTYTGYTVLNNQTVTLSDPSLGVNEAGGSGQITFTGTNTAGGTLSTWCVDIKDFLLGSGSLDQGTTLALASTNSINALLANATPLLAGNYDASSALQVAIWETEYGSALTVSGPSSMMTLANTYVSDVTTGAWKADATRQVAFLSGAGVNQDQVYLAPVPRADVARPARHRPARARRHPPRPSRGLGRVGGSPGLLAVSPPSAQASAFHRLCKDVKRERDFSGRRCAPRPRTAPTARQHVMARAGRGCGHP